MRTKFYLAHPYKKSRKITKREAMTLITNDQLKEAKMAWLNDPNECIEFMVRTGILRIEFEE